jgi:class 3 adenylate cyclase
MDKLFEELLVKYAHEFDPEERKKIEARLWQEFGVVKAVLVMDVSGFSLLTQKFGLIHYLSMVRRMQVISQPIIEEAGGEVVKFEADNCFATFEQPLQAVRAAVALNAAFAEINIYTEEQFDIRVSIGIDQGEVLLVGGPDFFGAVVSRAATIGEDLAGPGEIFITQAAFTKIAPAAGIVAEPLRLTVAGIELDAYSIQH